MLRKMSEIEIKQNLKAVLAKIEQACKRRPQELQYVEPTLVAVSKYKSPSVVVDAYEAGQRHFGENYVSELAQKAKHPVIEERCKDIKWHFIGHLQTNKAKDLLSVPNLHIIETVHSKPLAKTLNKHWRELGSHDSKMNVMIQINTSGEEKKSGVDPSEAVELSKYIVNECPCLQLDGLMTIGRFGYNPEDGPNPDFLALKRCRDEVCQSLELDWKSLNLSMGMSADFEHAIELGSTTVRVGTSIFGERHN